MQSIKNTTVSIVLLFLSYGVYQVITKPLPSEMQVESVESLEISDPRSEGAEIAFAPQVEMKNLDLPKSGDMFDEIEKSIPNHLLQQDQPFENQLSIASTSRSQNIKSPDVATHDNHSFTGSPSNESTPPSQPSFPVQLASSQQDFVGQANNVQNSFEPSVTPDLQPAQNDNHLSTDSNIVPTTVMSTVDQRPTDDSAFNNMMPSQEIAPPATPYKPTLAESWETINGLVERSKFPAALTELSRFYRDENLTPDERTQMLDWLDALAAKVIYSSEHHLRSLPYIIQPGDTIGSLARQWQVPAQLIYNVNTSKIPNPNKLEPGVEIKLIQGPFDAEIDSQQRVMTLFLDNMYAGRFNIQPGLVLSQGEFNIVDKSAQDHIDRPYWMALNNGTSIYASEAAPSQENEIGMNLREAEEVFSILSASSRIRVLR